MAVSFQLPTEIEKNLRQDLANLDEAAKEATLVEMYRQQKLSQHELALAMGLTRLEAEALLKKHNVTEDLPSAKEYDAALSRLRKMTAE
jgi:energy-converting hydrogenase A subunit M